MRVTEHPILDFDRGKEVEFSFEGQVFKGYEGEPILAALVAAGVKVLRYSPRLNRPRGIYCAIGNCSSCLMVVNGVPNVRVCETGLESGMQVNRQLKHGEVAYR